ncbi:rhodanese-like domain-containing protein [Slackia heliotrinireducens]|uniref:rhodanese-like domain-containing protein n=1 Tax=Slackia heliotrinireducens TaxID=84110 RepID=UPI0033156FCC
MGLFDMFSRPNINDGAKACADMPGAVLLDVREPDEFARGRIPGAVNLSVKRISEVEAVVPDKSTPVFIYCFGGGRADKAELSMRAMGYENVKSIGGISAYRGPVER